MADNFRDSSPGWLGQKLLRRIWETGEYWLSQIDWPELPEIPQWEPPDWLQGVFNFLAVLGHFTLLHWKGLLLALIIAICFFLGRWLSGRYGDRPFSSGTNAPLPIDPSLIPGSVNSWLDQAQAAQQVQQYSAACRALYFAMLLKLDEASIIPQLPSRTDREYLDLTQDLPQAEASQLLLETHERLCFSQASASEELFQHCLNAFSQIEQQVEVLLQAQRVEIAQAEVSP